MKHDANKSCADCHNPTSQDGTDSFDDIQNFDQLRSKGLALPAAGSTDPTTSPLYKILSRPSGFMPLGGKAPLTADQLAAVKAWIAAGAPSISSAAPVSASVPSFISNADVVACMSADLQKLTQADQPFARHLTLTHLFNAGRAQNLTLNQQGLAQLVNSLSYNATVTKPVAVDPASTIYRIDLRAYNWTPATWDSVLATNPYTTKFTSDAAQVLYQNTASAQPYMRGD